MLIIDDPETIAHQLALALNQNDSNKALQCIDLIAALKSPGIKFQITYTIEDNLTRSPIDVTVHIEFQNQKKPLKVLLYADENYTFSKMQQMIEEQCHIPIATQKWIVGDNLISNDSLEKKMVDYGITNAMEEITLYVYVMNLSKPNLSRQGVPTGTTYMQPSAISQHGRSLNNQAFQDKIPTHALKDTCVYDPLVNKNVSKVQPPPLIPAEPGSHPPLPDAHQPPPDVHLSPPDAHDAHPPQDAHSPPDAHPHPLDDLPPSGAHSPSEVQPSPPDDQKPKLTRPITHSPSPKFDKWKRFLVTNGEAAKVDIEDYGLTILLKSDCLPPTIIDCELLISADLTTDNPLPSDSLLVSGVYHITTVPFIDQLNQPVEISMEHCAKEIDNLSFVVAKDNRQQPFELVEGGTFERDSKTGRKIGRISVSSFSVWCIVINPLKWFTKVTYCAGVYYEQSRTIHFVITRNLRLDRTLIQEVIQSKAEIDEEIEFSEPKILLELPAGNNDTGWKLEPAVEPAEIRKREVDEFDRGKRLPRCIFTAHWTRDNQKPTDNHAVIKLCGTNSPCSIRVKCISAPAVLQVLHPPVPKPPHPVPSSNQTPPPNPGRSWDDEIKDIDIKKIAENLSDWQDVFWKLGMGKQVIKDIEAKHQGNVEQCKAALRKWIEDNGSNATYVALCTALYSLENKWAVEFISKIVGSSFPGG